MLSSRGVDVDLAGKEYWGAAWEAAPLPKAIDPDSRELWNHVSRRFHQLFTEVFRSTSTRGSRLLEIGCARSPWLPYFAQRFGFAVTGLDYSEVGVEQTRRVLRNEGVDGQVVLADFLTPPDAMLRSFDVVVSFGVVEHFRDTAAAIAAAARFLKPGGLLITEVPNMVGSVGWVTQMLNRPVYDIHVPLGREALEAATRRAGLEVQRCEYVVFVNFGICNLNGLPVDTLTWKLKRRLLQALTLVTGAAWILEERARWVRPGRLSAGYVISVGRQR